MNIVMFEAEDWPSRAQQRLSKGHSVRFTAESLNIETAPRYRDATVVSTSLASTLDAPTLRIMPQVCLIATRTTGIDHIDLHACEASNVTVSNVPAYGNPTVSEHAIALLLALSRKLPQAVSRTQHGDFSQEGLRGFDLAGKTLGIIGFGAIGQHVAKIARAFGMRVVAADVHPNLEVAWDLGVTFVELTALLKQCDVLSLHLPGGAGTRSLISTAELAQMKPHAVIVNTSRGDVIDATALLVALQENRIAGAALDVLAEEDWLRNVSSMFRGGREPEPSGFRILAADHALIAHPNVLVTPHIGYDTEEAIGRIFDTTIDNIMAFEAGAPKNVVPIHAMARRGTVAVEPVAQNALVTNRPISSMVRRVEPAMRSVALGPLVDRVAK